MGAFAEITRLGGPVKGEAGGLGSRKRVGLDVGRRIGHTDNEHWRLLLQMLFSFVIDEMQFAIATQVILRILSVVSITILLLFWRDTFSHAADEELIAKGEYLFASAGGCGCHTSTGGELNAGGRPLTTAFGTFYGTNITPDPVHGIGDWTDRQIVDALRSGVGPGGRALSPAMPYPAFSGMTDADAEALVAYLRSVPAVAQKNVPHEVGIPFQDTIMWLWRWVFFRPANSEDREDSYSSNTQWSRGRYLTDHVAHCTECHTPRTLWGSLRVAEYLKGNRDGIDGEPTGDITADEIAGIGRWTLGEIVELLRTGYLPNFDNVQGLMALVIDGAHGRGYNRMNDRDLYAIAGYLKSLNGDDKVRRDQTLPLD